MNYLASLKESRERRLHLQLFAEGTEPTGNGTGANVGTEPGKPTEPTKEPGTPTEPKTYTQEELDRIVKDRLAREKKEQAKKVAEAEKLAKMDAQQKAEYERDELQKQLDEYKRKDTLAEMSKTARKMLSDEGINIPDTLLSRLVTTDADETKSNIDDFAKLFNSAVEAGVKERLKGEPPKRGTGGPTGSMTKAEIMAIQDPELRQKKMLENKHLFNF